MDTISQILTHLHVRLLICHTAEVHLCWISSSRLQDLHTNSISQARPLFTHAKVIGLWSNTNSLLHDILQAHSCLCNLRGDVPPLVKSGAGPSHFLTGVADHSIGMLGTVLIEWSSANGAQKEYRLFCFSWLFELE